ncbi:MAG TPA: hypothetical protein VJC13_02815 [Candidatus Paceibacterota bacterium]|nr:hypothetical protein [uncultured archaeon]
MKEFILFLHPMLGVFGVITAVWVFVEVLNVSERNLKRINIASILTAILMVLTWITSGYWYIVYYAGDRALILKGPWAFAHNLVMESKEHVFFIVLVLSLFLPIVTKSNNLLENKPARSLVLTLTVLIVLISLALEGAGGIISFAVRMSLLGNI